MQLFINISLWRYHVKLSSVNRLYRQRTSFWFLNQVQVSLLKPAGKRSATSWKIPERKELQKERQCILETDILTFVRLRLASRKWSSAVYPQSRELCLLCQLKHSRRYSLRICLFIFKCCLVADLLDYFLKKMIPSCNSEL